MGQIESIMIEFWNLIGLWLRDSLDLSRAFFQFEPPEVPGAVALVGWVFCLHFPQEIDGSWGSQSLPRPLKLTTNCREHLGSRRKVQLSHIAPFQDVLVSRFASWIWMSLSTQVFSGYGFCLPHPSVTVRDHVPKWSFLQQSSTLTPHPYYSQHLIRAFLSQTPQSPGCYVENDSMVNHVGMIKKIQHI